MKAMPFISDASSAVNKQLNTKILVGFVRTKTALVAKPLSCSAREVIDRFALEEVPISKPILIRSSLRIIHRPRRRTLLAFVRVFVIRSTRLDNVAISQQLTMLETGFAVTFWATMLEMMPCRPHYEPQARF
jgi:hypothetical protein